MNEQGGYLKRILLFIAARTSSGDDQLVGSATDELNALNDIQSSGQRLDTCSRTEVPHLDAPREVDEHILPPPPRLRKKP